MKYLLFVAFASLLSCSSVEKAKAIREIEVLDGNNQDILLGIYNNAATNGDCEIYSLWSTLSYKDKGYENWQVLKVKLSQNETEQIVAELLDESGRVINNKILKGEYTNNYYLLERQYKTDFTYVALWIIGDSSVKLALTPQKDLLVLRESGGFAMLVAFPIFASNSPLIETIYARVN